MRRVVVAKEAPPFADLRLLRLDQAALMLEDRVGLVDQSVLSLAFAPGVVTADAAGLLAEGYAALRAVPAAVARASAAFIPVVATATSGWRMPTSVAMFDRVWAPDLAGASIH